jgi:hypothetical protein
MITVGPYASMLAAVTIHRPDFAPHIQIIDGDGFVRREIVFPPDAPFGYITGIAFEAPDQLLVSPGNDGRIYRTTLVGRETTLVATIGGVQSGLEGLALTDDGRLFAADHATGTLFALRASDFGRLANDDRNFRIGFGISRPRVAWDADAGLFLVSHTLGQGRIYAVRDDLKKADPLINLAATPFEGSVTGLSWVPGDVVGDGGFVAVGSQGARSVGGLFQRNDRRLHVAPGAGRSDVSARQLAADRRGLGGRRIRRIDGSARERRTTRDKVDLTRRNAAPDRPDGDGSLFGRVAYAHSTTRGRRACGLAKSGGWPQALRSVQRRCSGYIGFDRAERRGRLFDCLDYVMVRPVDRPGDG